jgi:hypothetical protein
MRDRAGGGLLARGMLRGILNDQRGQSSTDYMGMLAVVAVVVGALVASGVGERVATHADELICRIAGGTNCAKPKPQAKNPHEPWYPCIRAATSEKVTLSGSFNVRFVNVKLEGGVEYERVQRSDGRVAITVRLNNKNSVGAALASKLKVDGVDARITGGLGEGGVTFVLDDNAAANKFADQLKETTKALAAGPIVSRIAGWDAHIDVPPVESVYYQTGPGASVKVGKDAYTAYAEGKVDISHAVGARYNVKKGETTVYYMVKGSAEGEAGALAGQIGGAFNGDAQIGVTVDSSGRPVRLTFIGTGTGEIKGGLGGKYKNLDQLIKNLPKGTGVDVTAQQGRGKRFEVQADLDLTDPQLRAAALSFLQGVGPGGGPADAAQAGKDLTDAILNNSTVSVRTYDTKSGKYGGGLDVAGNGGSATYETADRELTGAWYLDPTRGFVPWEACFNASAQR